MKLWMVIVMVCMAEFGLHYFPYRMFLRGRELPRVAAYTCGVLGMMLPFTAWVNEQGTLINTQMVLTYLWASIGSAGVMVALLYLADHYSRLDMRDLEHGERDELRKKQDGS